jgi:hypothetical protein
MEYDNLPSSVWAVAWCTLYGIFEERLDQENLDLMDSVLQSVEADMRDEIERLEQ